MANKKTKKPDPEEFKKLSVDEVLKQFNINPDKGLSEEDIKKNRQKYGWNALEEEEKKSWIIRYLSHYWGPIPWMLEIACILAIIAQRWEDFAVIFVMLLINGSVSYLHESKADKAIQALKKKLSPKARVIRNGEQTKIDARELVPGDIVKLQMGDVVPADIKLLPDQYLSIDESALTGESVPVDKDKNDLTYSGTTVKRGQAKGLVTATGQNTKFAKTVELVEKAEEKSHFQKAVLRIGYFLIGITFILVAGIVVTGIIRENELMQVLMFALVVTIAGIPQALPAVLSVTMTIGARRLAGKKAIVSKLSSMEEMAGLEVLCADKTGTLTLNQLQLEDPVVLKAKDKHDLIISAGLTCKREDTEDPIDLAVLEGIKDKSELDKYSVKDFRPFNPTDKRAEADVEFEGKSFTVAKGAPQVILDLVNAGEKQQKEIKAKVDELGKKGFRALGVGRKENNNWEYLGILALLDPPREDIEEVIKDAQNRGIDIRMVTGDHIAIGRQVAEQIGLGTNFKEADEIFGKREGGKEEIDKEVANADGFAEVTPEHKYNIIKHFQRQNKIAGMTGDGVNDAPALKQADVGIAVSNATDAARSASNLVLTAPGLNVIIQAVEEARRIFERMTSYSTFRITESMRVLLFMTLSILIFDFYPVTAIMVVLLAILNDIPIMLIAYDNVKTSRKPVRWNMPRVLTTASILSVGGVISSFLLFWYIVYRAGYSEDTVRTMIFLKLLVAGHMTIFLTRNTGWLWDKPFPNIWFFIALEGTQVLGTLFAVYGWIIPAVGWGKALAVWGYAIIWLLFLNVVKVFANKIMSKHDFGRGRSKKELREKSENINA